MGAIADEAVATPSEGVRCDALGCVAKLRDGALVAVDARVDALAEDCANAKIVVSAVPARRFCNGPALVIDRIDIARKRGLCDLVRRSHAHRNRRRRTRTKTVDPSPKNASHFSTLPQGEGEQFF